MVPTMVLSYRKLSGYSCKAVVVDQLNVRESSNQNVVRGLNRS